jgi:hypothetical protein
MNVNQYEPSRNDLFFSGGMTVTQLFPFKTFFAIAMLSLVSTALPAVAQSPPKEGPKPDKEALAEAEKESRRAAEKLVSGIEVEIFSDDKWTKVKRVEKPLLLFGDDTREIAGGSVWAWGDQGRPVAMLELYKDGIRKRWDYGITNTSGGKIRASYAGKPWWLENESIAVLKDVPQAPTPAAEAPQRQRQLKLLAQKFTGYELWDPNKTRYDLRRIERAVHTYRDEEHGLLEGGVFILANGTNPEIVFFVEARTDPKDKSKAIWQCAFGRSGFAEMHLEYDGKELFNAPRANGHNGPRKPFLVGGLAALEPDPEPRKE